MHAIDYSFIVRLRFLLDNFVQIIYIYTHTYIYFFSGLVSKYIFVKFLNSYEPRFWSNKYYINNLYIFVQGKKKGVERGSNANYYGYNK